MQDRNGNEFQKALIERGTQGKYVPRWGKGFKEIKENIEWEIEENPKIKNIIVLIAGNDIKRGKKYCQEQLNEIMKFNPKYTASFLNIHKMKEIKQIRKMNGMKILKN